MAAIPQSPRSSLTDGPIGGAVRSRCLTTSLRRLRRRRCPTVAQLEYHPVACIFPLIEGEAFQDLANDIAEHGLREPILAVTEGGVRQIADGRNRYRACLARGIEPRFREWDGNGSLVAYVFSLNVHRRHLPAGMRATLVLQAASMMEREAASRMKAGTLASIDARGKTAEKLAKIAGVSAKAMERAKRVERDAVPEVKEKVRDGTMAVSRAEEISKKPPEEQLKAMAEEAKRVKGQNDQFDLKDLADRHIRTLDKLGRQVAEGTFGLGKYPKLLGRAAQEMEECTRAILGEYERPEVKP